MNKKRSYVDRRTAGIVKSIIALIEMLPSRDRPRALSDCGLSAYCSHGRASSVLAEINSLKTDVFTVRDLSARLFERGFRFEQKEVYNIMGYLTRRKYVRRKGYGVYVRADQPSGATP